MAERNEKASARFFRFCSINLLCFGIRSSRNKVYAILKVLLKFCGKILLVTFFILTHFLVFTFDLESFYLKLLALHFCRLLFR